MKIITFDTENVTSSCPLSDAGLATREECQDCDYFVEADGFDVICRCGEIMSVEEFEPYITKVIG